jgi:hypothetical protein
MRSLKAVFVLALLILIMLSLDGCKSGEKNNPIASTYLFPPVATGMWITDQSNQPEPARFVIGQWGNPTDDIHAYPNPFRYYQVIVYDVKEDSSNITLVIVPAKSPFDKESQTELANGAVSYTAPEKPIIKQESFVSNAGLFYFKWSADGYPDGFYRIYIEVNGKLVHTDVFIAHNSGAFPKGIVFYYSQYLGLSQYPEFRINDGLY